MHKVSGSSSFAAETDLCNNWNKVHSSFGRSIQSRTCWTWSHCLGRSSSTWKCCFSRTCRQRWGRSQGRRTERTSPDRRSAAQTLWCTREKLRRRETRRTLTAACYTASLSRTYPCRCMCRANRALLHSMYGGTCDKLCSSTNPIIIVMSNWFNSSFTVG